MAGGGLPSADLGDGGPASQAFLLEPSAIALDTSDNIFIVDTFNNRLRRVDSITSIISTVAGGGILPMDWGTAVPPPRLHWIFRMGRRSMETVISTLPTAVKTGFAEWTR